jgi:hypothetical protein
MWAEKLDHSEQLMEQHAKKQDRHTKFYKRQIDKSQCLANALREELNNAKLKLEAVEHGSKIVERNMHFALCDKDREKKSLITSLERQVCKVASLLANRRGLQAKSARDTTSLSRASAQKVDCLKSGILVCLSIILFACYFC